MIALIRYEGKLYVAEEVTGIPSSPYGCHSEYTKEWVTTENKYYMSKYVEIVEEINAPHLQAAKKLYPELYI